MFRNGRRYVFNILRFRKKSFKGCKVRNKYGYLLKAVENDYATAVPQLKLGYRIDNL